MKTDNVNSVSRFSWMLCWLAGVDAELLANCSNKERMKYHAQGFLVLVPALFALPSASYFIKTSFYARQDWGIYPAMAFASFYALVVLMFDRSLLLTFRAGNWKGLIVRILVGGLMAYTLAEPLVALMFRDTLVERLDAKHRAEKTQLIAEYDSKIAAADQAMNALSNKASGSASLDKLTQQSPEVRELNGQLQQKQQELMAAQTEYADEVAGNGASRTGKAGDGPVAQSILKRVHSIEDLIDDLQQQLEVAQTKHQEVLDLEKQRLAKDEDNQQRLKQLDIARIQQLQTEIASLTADRNRTVAGLEEHAAYDYLALTNELDVLAAQEPNVWWKRWLLTATLFLLDMMAILLKLLSHDDDDQLEQLQHMQNDVAAMDAEVARRILLATAPERVERAAELARFEHEELVMQQAIRHSLRKLELLTEFIPQHSAKVSSFHDLYFKSASFDDKLLAEFNEAADQLFNDIVKRAA